MATRVDERHHKFFQAKAGAWWNGIFCHQEETFSQGKHLFKNKNINVIKTTPTTSRNHLVFQRVLFES